MPAFRLSVWGQRGWRADRPSSGGNPAEGNRTVAVRWDEGKAPQRRFWRVENRVCLCTSDFAAWTFVLNPVPEAAEDLFVLGKEVEAATGGAGALKGLAPGWWGLYGPRVLVSLLVVAVPAGGAVYALRVSESAPKVVYTASLEEVETESQDSLKVDINSADVEELDELPEVGPATAEAIIEYRRANGSFTSVDELEGVPGIGPTTIQKIEPFATV